MSPVRAVLLLLVAGTAFGQQYEVGADVGYGLYRNGSIYSASGKLQAGIRNRFAAGILLGDEFSQYVSAEFRYLYQDGHPFLQGLGVKSDIQGQSDTLTGELVFHFKPRGHRWRPFVAGGEGLYYCGSRAVPPADSANRQLDGERRMEGRLQRGRRG